MKPSGMKSAEEVLAEQLKDPAFREEWERTALARAVAIRGGPFTIQQGVCPRRTVDGVGYYRNHRRTRDTIRHPSTPWRSPMRRRVPILALALLTTLPATARAKDLAWQRPGAAQINRVMSTTVEVTDRREHFKAFGRGLTIRDGRGTGALTAVVGVRYPTADAYGQVVFFWHNRRFVGWDSPWEKTAIMRVWSPAPGVFAIKYARYRARDPLCCPTRKPLVIRSAWSGAMFIANGVPPRGPGKPVRITRLR